MVHAWKEHSREQLIDGYGRAIDRVYFELPNGVIKEFYLKREGTPVVTLALTANHEVILVKQFRPGPQRVMHELPGGGIDGEETPQEAVARELKEETGYQGNVEYVGVVYECGYADKWRYCFVATACEEVAPQNFDQHEFIEREIVSLDTLRTYMRNGDLTDIDVAYLGLDYLGML
ncbi:MAG: NUDIX hydrolase [Parcubacteria group bacterium SW_4_49_11]|nr:MAG: NUDIX hydrolase [Parcubacteria group bacterium SW_4_49_11]